MICEFSPFWNGIARWAIVTLKLEQFQGKAVLLLSKTPSHIQAASLVSRAAIKVATRLSRENDEVVYELKSQRNRLWIWIFQSKFHESISWILTHFGVHFSFTRRYRHIHFCRICSDVAILFFFFNCRHHTFWLIFSILMRAISLKNGLKFAYHTHWIDVFKQFWHKK